MESNLLEKLIIKTCASDKSFLATLSSVFKGEYLDNPTASRIYDMMMSHFKQYGDILPQSVIMAEIDKDGHNDAQSFYEDMNTVDFDLARHYQLLFDQTNEYLKEKAIKQAILSSVDVINTRKDEISGIRNLIEEALCKDLKIDLGLNYFGSLGERLERLLKATNIRVPTYFPQFDEYINGGFPPYTLSVIVAKIHGHKSSFLANLAARQVLRGHNVVLASMEMSEDAFAQRFDSIFSLLDINQLYKNSVISKKMMRELLKTGRTPGRGELFIKQYPTGKATCEDIRKYIRELTLRGIKPSILYCDYLNLMKPSYKSKGDLYSDVKTIAEELRALSFEFVMPVVSVSQLNREGSNMPFEQTDFTYISESIAVAATSDMSVIFGSNEDKAVYSSELWYKIVKNRLGGRVGEIDKFYHDQRNLKLYDVSEMEIWLSDCNISGDTRSMQETAPAAQASRGQRSGGRARR